MEVVVVVLVEDHQVDHLEAAVEAAVQEDHQVEVQEAHPAEVQEDHLAEVQEVHQVIQVVNLKMNQLQKLLLHLKLHQHHRHQQVQNHMFQQNNQHQLKLNQHQQEAHQEDLAEVEVLRILVEDTLAADIIHQNLKVQQPHLQHLI